MVPGNDLITFVLFCIAILLITPVLGRYIAHVLEEPPPQVSFD